MGKYVVKQTASGAWRFNLKAGNGEKIIGSENYTTRAACDNGIESVKTNSQLDERYEKKKAKDGSPFFNLKASNGQVIGTSEMFSSNSAMENGIKTVKEIGPNAPIVEE